MVVRRTWLWTRQKPRPRLFSIHSIFWLLQINDPPASVTSSLLAHGWTGGHGFGPWFNVLLGLDPVFEQTKGSALPYRNRFHLFAQQRISGCSLWETFLILGRRIYPPRLDQQQFHPHCYRQRFPNPKYRLCCDKSRNSCTLSSRNKYQRNSSNIKQSRSWILWKPRPVD